MHSSNHFYPTVPSASLVVSESPWPLKSEIYNEGSARHLVLPIQNSTKIRDANPDVPYPYPKSNELVCPLWWASKTFLQKNQHNKISPAPPQKKKWAKIG